MKAELLHLPTHLIDADPDQPRTAFPDESLHDLADSIRENGMLQPIVVRRCGQRFSLVIGERRLRAAQLLGLDTVPAIERDIEQTDCGLIQLVENIQREELSLGDLGRAVSKLVDVLGFPEACRHLGRSKTWVSRHATLRDLPESVAQAVESGAVRDVVTAQELKQMHRVAPERVREIVDRQGGLTRAKVLTARAELEAQSRFTPSAQRIAPEKMVEIASRFISIMGNPAMAPNAKFVALMELHRSITADRKAAA